MLVIFLSTNNHSSDTRVAYCFDHAYRWLDMVIYFEGFCFILLETRQGYM